MLDADTGHRTAPAHLKNNGTWEETPGQSERAPAAVVRGLNNTKTFKPSRAVIGTVREKFRAEKKKTWKPEENKEVKHPAFRHLALAHQAKQYKE